MKLSTTMFTASISFLLLGSLILVGVSPEQEFWGETVATGFFSSAACIVFCCAAEANGH
jgi:hypothetical protein